jgi:NDP-sugar pyrophosphorylase family protein
MLYDIPSDRRVSLETELFLRWLAEGRSVRAFICQGRCFDIGTTERYRNAQNGLAAAEISAGALQLV